MRNRIQTMIDERANVVTQARALLDDNAEQMTAEVEGRHGEMMADADRLSRQIDTLTRQMVAEAEMARPEARAIVPPLETLAGLATDPQAEAVARAVQYRTAYDRYMRGDINAEAEVRGMSTLTGPSGSYFVPTDLESRIIQALNLYTPYRGICTVIQTTNDRDIPIANQDGLAYWTGETVDYTPSDETLALKTLRAHKLTALIKVSEELLADSAFDVGGFVSNQFGRRFASKEEAAVTTGTGVNSPYGWTQTAELGVTAASSSAVTLDEIVDLFYSLKAPYRDRGTWILKDQLLAIIRKAKSTTTGNYLWQPSLAVGQPDTILGRPVATCDSLASIAASATVAGFGDYSYYWIADRGQRAMQRLNELYSGSGQVGFRMYGRIDGALMLPEAVKKLVMHS